MEFFAYADARLSGAELQKFIRIETLPKWCAAITEVLDHSGERGEIYCVWGNFRVHREVIRDGIRFSLPGCPNALQWTLMAEPVDGRDCITVHCTINRVEYDTDFVESIHEFVQEWKRGLEQGWEQARRGRPTPEDHECMPWYG